MVFGPLAAGVGGAEVEEVGRERSRPVSIVRDALLGGRIVRLGHVRRGSNYGMVNQRLSPLSSRER
jgi:hypothetical protein